MFSVAFRTEVKLGHLQGYLSLKVDVILKPKKLLENGTAPLYNACM